MAISESKVKNALTDVLSAHFKSGVVIDNLEIVDMPELSVTTDSYRLKVDYHKSNGKPSSNDNLSVFLQTTSTDKSVDFAKLGTKRQEKDYDYKIAELSNERGCPVGIVYGRRRENGTTFYFKEDLGDTTLETKLLNNPSDQGSLLHETIERLADLHSKWGNLPTHDMSKEKEILTKWINYIDLTLKSNNRPTLSKNAKNVIRSALSPLSEFLEYEDIKFYKPIHGDCHPAQIFFRHGKSYFNDFSRVALGPLPFDVLDILQYPLVRLDEKGKDELYRFYMMKYSEKLAGTLGFTVARLNERTIDEFIMLTYASAFHRSLRAAAKSSLLKKNFPDVYLNYIAKNPFYDLHPSIYLAQFGESFKPLIENNRYYGLRVGRFNDFKSTIIEHLPEIKGPPPILELGKKQIVNN